jgi:nucleoside-diphosphate-sugar epimerase
MRVVFIGGTGPLGQGAIPHVLEGGHEVAVAHSGGHEPPALTHVEHLHGDRAALLAARGPVKRWKPDVVVDSFPGGATAKKAAQAGALTERVGAAQIVAISSMDVYRHCANAAVDDNPPAELTEDWLPLSEDAPRRTGPSPHRGDAHDNVAMEDALRGAPRLTVLRPGAIYGPHLHRHVLREWYLVGKVARGERTLDLPEGGTQLFHRVSLDRVGRAVAAAIERAPEGRWACNVGDPRDLTFGGLANLVAQELDWSWEPRHVGWADSDHPWNVRHPVVTDVTRLRDVLGVAEPDPVEATREQLRWLWEHRDEVAAFHEKGEAAS